MIVLDASVLIAVLDGADSHHAAAWHLVDSSREAFGINPVTLGEVLVGPARSGPERLSASLEAVAELEIQQLPFPDDASVRLANLRAETGLRMPDCCVLLTADHSGSSVATYDVRLAAVAARRGAGLAPA